MPNESPLKAFLKFTTDVKSLGALLGKGAILAPPAIALLTNFGPPWPNSVGVSFLTSLVEVVVLMVIFQEGKLAPAKRLKKWSKKALLLLVTTLIGYLLLFGFFVADMPDANSRDVKGVYFYTDLAKKTINDVYIEKKALAGAGWDPTIIWEPWTVYTMRLAVALSWLTFFASTAAFFGIFVIREQQHKPTVPQTSAQNGQTTHVSTAQPDQPN